MAKRRKQGLPLGDNDNSGISSSILLPPSDDSVCDSPPVDSATSPVLATSFSSGKDFKLNMSRDQWIRAKA